ncbi:hypothetical protein [Corallococcus macrosporus]|uniref:Uncharacterized protein n=2 Tax=Myxococcaceae TaxID=31 RepID=A0A250JP04_9BACT|nr:hypothetical protein [Corallococcus macrosporus]AEI62496.1 hypothetical protein LILAB_02855 [Corallococcus macrosporus]ATB45599.1 hypothetical protein MYMAC_001184 [Corallococcus macrosporus DSM 14697]
MRKSLRPSRSARGQSMVEYAIVTASLLVFSVGGWPFLVALLNALHRYFNSIYYVIQAPI